MVRTAIILAILLAFAALKITVWTDDKADLPPLPPSPLVYEHRNLDQKMIIKILEEFDYKEYKLLDVNLDYWHFSYVKYCKRKDWEQYEKERLELERQFKEKQEQEKGQEK